MSHTIEPYPWFLNKPFELTVNDRPVAARITVQDWTDHWRPLLSHLYQLHQAKPERILIAIGGPPGSGKSVLAEQINWLALKNILPECNIMALPMDGFHYPNDYLRTHTRKMLDGERVPLLEVKGAPDTFDIEALRHHLELLKDHREEVTWPGYSRIDHEPIPQRYHVTQGVNVILVEGNYLLLDRGPFAGFPALFDYRIYVETPAAAIISNLVQRHIRGGKSLDQAKAWVKRIDLPNARIVESTRANSDLVVERNIGDDIIALHWHHHSPPTPDTPSASITE